MVRFRSARLGDIKQLQEIEEEHYEGHSCPKETMEEWFKMLPENFILAESNGKIASFIFFEYVDIID